MAIQAVAVRRGAVLAGMETHRFAVGDKTMDVLVLT
jgi:hypothetical protein